MNSNDYARTNLVARLVCAKCGHTLHMTYTPPAAPIGDDYQHSDGITGAAKVDVKLGVYPCEVCYSAALEPIQALRRIIESAGRVEL